MISQQLNGLNKNFCVMTTMNISVVNNMHLNEKVWFTLIHKANIHSAESKLVPTRNINYQVNQIALARWVVHGEAGNEWMMLIKATLSIQLFANLLEILNANI